METETITKEMNLTREQMWADLSDILPLAPKIEEDEFTRQDFAEKFNIGTRKSRRLLTALVEKGEITIRRVRGRNGRETDGFRPVRYGQVKKE